MTAIASRVFNDQSEPRRFGIFNIGREQLVKALHLPPDTKIVVGSVFGFGNEDGAEIIVEQQHLPEVKPGDEIPRLEPRYRMSPKRMNDTEMVSWGL